MTVFEQGPGLAMDDAGVVTRGGAGDDEDVHTVRLDGGSECQGDGQKPL